MPAPRFQMSADTKILTNVLSEAVVGQTITYDELSKAIGRDCREYARGSINTARRTLLRDSRVVFEAVHNVGLKRLNDVEIIGSLEFDRKRVLKATTRSLSKLECVEYDKLDDNHKVQHTTSAAQLGAIRLMGKASTTKRIESKVKENGNTLAIGETLKMFT